MQIAQTNKELIEANEELEKLKEKRRIKEQLEEKKIEEFAIKKQEMVDLRKGKENQTKISHCLVESLSIGG